MASTRATARSGGCARCRDSEPAAEGAEGSSACRQCGRLLADARSGCSSPLTVPAAGAAAASAPAATGRGGRVMTRFRRQAQAKQGGVPKGKGRRIIFKKSAVKAPLAVATPVTSNYLFHKGIYYQVGDIVSVVSLEGDIYYAQIRGLLQDQYCEKSAVITWLLPTTESPPPEQGFDPATYTIGPDEEIPRCLACMELVCSAPSDYFKQRHSPYPTPATGAGRTGFVFTRLGPVAIPADRARQYMV
ncbi:GATA zinc finger domain-containing protein 1-like [Amphibalanus amphitrite]|uniref:GATA zinc finger domain-containing protein 1-like n=1 Tax=Amphibalanus amphitrite TaxID=1232801 RepID=UPI001C907604|nr:GATA zinc finger domain-containing protein 1-like [Amphibalanus amphitrite]